MTLKLFAVGEGGNLSGGILKNEHCVNSSDLSVAVNIRNLCLPLGQGLRLNGKLKNKKGIVGVDLVILVNISEIVKQSDKLLGLCETGYVGNAILADLVKGVEGVAGGLNGVARVVGERIGETVKAVYKVDNIRNILRSLVVGSNGCLCILKNLDVGNLANILLVNGGDRCGWPRLRGRRWCRWRQ